MVGCLAAFVTVLAYFGIDGKAALRFFKPDCYEHPIDFYYGARLKWCENISGFSLHTIPDHTIKATNSNETQWQLIVTMPSRETLHLRQDGAGEFANIIMYRRCSTGKCTPWQHLVSANYVKPS